MKDSGMQGGFCVSWTTRAHGKKYYYPISLLGTALYKKCILTLIYVISAQYKHINDDYDEI